MCDCNSSYKIPSSQICFLEKVMKITYNFYNANRSLPDPEWLFQVTRRADFLMRSDPNKNWQCMKEWVRPMCQLPCGLFWNITGTPKEEIEKKIDLNGPKSEDLRLEMQWIDQGYIRIQFWIEGMLLLNRLDCWVR